MDVRLRELYLLFRGYEVHGLVCVQMYFVTLLVMLTRRTCTALSSSHAALTGITPANTCSFMYIQSTLKSTRHFKQDGNRGLCRCMYWCNACTVLSNVWSYTRASTPVWKAGVKLNTHSGAHYIKTFYSNFIRCLPQLCTTKIVRTPCTCTCKSSLVSIITLNSSRWSNNYS